MRAFAAWKEAGGKRDTVAWLLDTFTTLVCAGKVKAKALAPRTARDYKRDAETLKAGLGHIGIRRLEPRHVADYRNAREPDAPSHVRNELACLSAAMAYAVETGLATTNPCREVRRTVRRRRERLIAHEEYLAVYDRAGPMIRRAMTLAIRTLAQPADILRMGPRDVVRRGDRRVLRFLRGKTRRPVEVEIVGELARVIDEALAEQVVRETFVHARSGAAYTVSGVGAMFRRHCVTAKVADFGLRDLRAKGATDMYLAGGDVRTICSLLGHATEQTTRIYIKSYLPETVRPNEVAIVAAAPTSG